MLINDLNKTSSSFSNPSNSIATCDTAADVAEKVIVVNDDKWELKVGCIIMVKFSISNTASNVKFNVNGTGAYPIWYNTSEYTSTSSAYAGYANRTITYVFNGTHWVWIGASYITSYSNESLGNGYGTCTTAEATVAKAVTLSSYTLKKNGIVSVKFTNAVPANATMNINSKGAKKIFYKGVAITAGIIKAGDIATFMYDGTQYHLISIDNIGGTEDLSKLQTNSKDSLVDAINEVFQDVDNGKQLIADAIDDSTITKDSAYNAMSDAIIKSHESSEEEEIRKVLLGMMIEDNYAQKNNGISDLSTEKLIDILHVGSISTENIKQIACGDNFFYVLKNDGTLYSCGKNDYGQLGLNDIVNRTILTQVNIKDVKQVSCGGNFAYVLKNDDTVWSCGRNNYGQLGLNNTTDKTTFTQVTANINDVKDIVCGQTHAYILRNDGSLWSCGRNNYGQLGLGNTTTYKKFTQVTTNINNDVKQISCFYIHAAIVKNDGSLWTCGYNSHGQLGLGEVSAQYNFTQVTDVGNDVKQVSCGGYHTLILKNDDTLWGAGRNGNGQLGHWQSAEYSNFFKVQGSTSSIYPENIKHITCGNYHSCVIDGENIIWATGLNEDGQLGVASNTNTFGFKEVPYNIYNDVKQVDCGNYFTIISKNDGSIWTCGRNEEGRLGLGDLENRNIFTRAHVSSVYDYKLNKSKLYHYLAEKNIPVTESMDIKEMLNVMLLYNTKKLLADAIYDRNIEDASSDLSLSELIKLISSLQAYKLVRFKYKFNVNAGGKISFLSELNDGTAVRKTNWGDGVENNETSHTYTNAGTYTVETNLKIATIEEYFNNGSFWIRHNYDYNTVSRLISVEYFNENATDMSGMFYYCTNLTTAVCGPNITNMAYAYDDCRNLTGTAACGPNVTDMSRAYNNCQKLTKAACGNKVTNMYYAYYNCHNLTGAAACGPNVVDLSGAYSHIDASITPVCGPNVVNMYEAYGWSENITGSPVCGNKVTNMSRAYFWCEKITGSPVCGPNVIDMTSAYEDCANLTGSPAVGPNVIYMTSAYEGCHNITGAAVCNPNVTSLSYSYWGTGVTTAVCGNNVVSLSNAYTSCQNLKTSVCGPNVTNMCGAYYNCRNIVGIPACGNKVVNLSGAYAMTDVNTAVCPNSVIDMSGTYSYCDNIKTAVCGPNVTNMNSTYQGCNNLSNFICGNNVTDFSYAYQNCRNTKSSPICGPNVTNMACAYDDCRNITGSPVCGNKVIDMSEAYYYCTNLTGSPVCGPNVTDMANTYYNCYNLKGSPVCGDKVISMHNTYYNCYNLTGNAIIGPNVTSSTNAYYNCSKLTGAIVYAQGYLGANIFANCTNLQTIKFVNATAVPNVNTSFFPNINSTNCKIYVPINLYDSWISSSNWSAWNNRIFPNVDSETAIALFDTTTSLRQYCGSSYSKQYSILVGGCNANTISAQASSYDSSLITVSNITKNIIDSSVAKFTYTVTGKDIEGLANITITVTGSKTHTISSTINCVQISESITIEDVEGATYGFALQSDGYYMSENKGKNSSYAICKIVVANPQRKTLKIDCMSNGESKYDYALISQPDTKLSLSYQADAAGVFYSYKGQSSESFVTHSLSNAIEVTYYIKYIKDNSSNSGLDVCKFRVYLS